MGGMANKIDLSGPDYDDDLGQALRVQAEAIEQEEQRQLDNPENVRIGTVSEWTATYPPPEPTSVGMVKEYKQTNDGQWWSRVITLRYRSKAGL